MKNLIKYTVGLIPMIIVTVIVVSFGIFIDFFIAFHNATTVYCKATYILEDAIPFLIKTWSPERG